MKAQGQTHIYPDNVDTDVIIPARYLNTSDPKELASHCMCDIDADFVNKVKPGDIMVAGWNFGCGSSREHAPIAIKESGISCVIAKSFARIFYRNAINIGLPILECEQASDSIQAGDEIEIDIPRRSIRLMASDDEIAARMAAQQHFRPAARDRRIPASLRAYAKLVSSADKGAVRIVEEE